jgi:hypothetical protein
MEEKNMNLVQFNVVFNGDVDSSPWGSPWLCSIERAIEVAEEMPRGGELWPAVPVELTLVEQVKAYARAHYNTGGWDVIVECWDDSRIADALQLDTGDSAKDLNEALTSSTLASVVDVWADQQKDATVEGCTGDEWCSYHGSH